jgi:chloramphenicol O-acetyltransferase
MKTHPLGADLFHANGQMNRHEEANSHILQLVNAPNMIFQCISLNTQNTEKCFKIKSAGRSEQDIHFILQFFVSVVSAKIHGLIFASCEILLMFDLNEPKIKLFSNF